MFKREKSTDEQPKKKAPDQDDEETENAYEDSWYRSLKAMSERDGDEDEQVGVPED